MFLPPFESWTDEQILDWIKNKINDKEKENKFLDYKSKFNLSPAGRKELVKDITGFANEIGGVILVGVPEEEDHPGVPKAEFGIAKGLDLLRIENIIRDNAMPQLPALFMKEIVVDHDKNLSVYLITHPQSWLRPHMNVSGSGDKVDFRYYKRGIESTVPMQEHEVDALYQERYAQQIILEDYLSKEDLGETYLSEQICGVQLVIVPMPIRTNLIDFHSAVGRDFAEKNTLIQKWNPCKDGLITHRNTDPDNSRYIAKFFPSGMFVFTHALSLNPGDPLDFDLLVNTAFAPQVKGFLAESFVQLNISGSVMVILKAWGLNGRELILTDSVGFLDNRDIHRRYVTGNDIRIDFEVSAYKIAKNPEAIRTETRDRLVRLFGRWEAPKESK